MWDYEKGEQKQTIAGHTRQVTRLIFAGKTNTFVTCSGDQTVRMINVDNGTNVRNFAGSADFLYAVGVSPDGALAPPAATKAPSGLTPTAYRKSELPAKLRTLVPLSTLIMRTV